MTEISLIEVYKIVDSFLKYFEGNFLVEHLAETLQFFTLTRKRATARQIRFVK